jgi:hypothetical protein
VRIRPIRSRWPVHSPPHFLTPPLHSFGVSHPLSSAHRVGGPGPKSWRFGVGSGEETLEGRMPSGGPAPTHPTREAGGTAAAVSA